MSTNQQVDEQKGLLRLLIAAHYDEGLAGLTSLNMAIVLASRGGPAEARFAMGDDLNAGQGEFADCAEPAEFREHTDVRASGLWIVAWDWQMKPDDDFDEPVAAYGEDRWSRPTHADLVAFGLLPDTADV